MVEAKDALKEKATDVKESLQETGSNISKKGKGMTWQCKNDKSYLIDFWLIDVKEGFQNLGERAEEKLEGARSNIAEKKQG